MEVISNEGIRSSMDCLLKILSPRVREERQRETEREALTERTDVAGLLEVVDNLLPWG